QPGGAGGYVIDVTEQQFQTEVLEASSTYVVVLSLWSPRAPESKTFNETLARFTNSYQGSLMLSQVNIDTCPQIALAVGAQGVPFVLGLVKGQPVPLFQGTVDESEVRRFFDELIKVAVANGVSGVAEPQPGVEPQPEQEEEGSDPRFAKADEAFAAGD